MFRNTLLLFGILAVLTACTTDEEPEAAAVGGRPIEISSIAPKVAGFDEVVTLTGTGFGEAGGLVMLNKTPPQGRRVDRNRGQDPHPVGLGTWFPIDDRDCRRKFRR